MKQKIKKALKAFFLSIIILAVIVLLLVVFFPQSFELAIQQADITFIAIAAALGFIVFALSWLFFSLIEKKRKELPEEKEKLEKKDFSNTEAIEYVELSKKELEEKEGSNPKGIKYVVLSEKDFERVKHGKRVPEIEAHESAKKSEVKEFEKEIKHSKGLGAKKVISKKSGEILPTRIPDFDELIEDGGLERGTTILVSGGAGTGKTTFGFQTLYQGALKGEKGIYISLEEEIEKIKKHMKKNFGWGVEELEKKGLIALIKMDSLEIARKVEAATLKGTKELEIEIGELELPFTPDRIVVDSLSALGLAFGSTESYRIYIHYLFEMLEKYNSLNFVLAETEQNPKIYSRAGIQEFLADGVIVLYNIQSNNVRQTALEILKLRSSKHEKKIVPYKFTKNGLKVYPEEEVF